MFSDAVSRRDRHDPLAFLDRSCARLCSRRTNAFALLALVALFAAGCTSGCPLLHPSKADAGTPTPQPSGDAGTVATPPGTGTPAGFPATASPYLGSTGGVTMPTVRDPVWRREGTKNLDRLNLARLPTRGAASTVIAVLDTGVDDTAPQLAGAIAPGWDMVLDRSDMIDEHGHGTMLAHAAAGRPRGTNTVASPCQACSIMPIRISTGSDTGDFTTLDDRLARGLRWARDHGAAIAVIGLAADVHPPLTSAAVEEVVRDGLVVIAPAGNQGAAIAGFPARLEGVISVGASRGSEDVALPQANGPFGVDVWAPADTDFLPVAGGATRRGGGSSIAAAYTAGVAGLLRTLHPTLSPAAVRSLLISSAAPLEPAGSKQRLPGGRIDATAAISKVYPAPSTDRIADLAISFAELLPRKPKPGQTGRVRIRVQNMGTLPIDLDDAVLRLWRGARAEWFNSGTGVLAPGESKWFELPYTAPSTPGADPIIAEIAEKPGHIIGGPGVATILGNDSRRVLSHEIVEPSWQELVAVVPTRALSERSSDVEVVTTDTKNIELIELQEELTRPPDPDRITILATYANTGNTDLIAGVDASVAGAVVARMAAEAWPTGSRRSFRVTLERAQLPATQHWIVALRPTIMDDDPNDDAFDVKIPSRHAAGFRLAYGDFSGNDLIFDAPFRVNSNRRVIPFLSFVPEWGDSRDVVLSYSVYANDGHISLASGFDPDVIQNHWQTQGSLVFMSTRQRNRRGESIVGLPDSNGRTRRSSWRPEVVDEDGRVHTNRYFGSATVTRNHGAFHRVLRVPWDAATHDFPNRRRQPTVMFFLTQYTVLEHGFFGGSEEHYWAVLRVVLDTLPEATGTFQGRYYDAHFHTIAEGSEGILTGGIAPAQSWAAPLTMVAESAYAHGFTERRDLNATALMNRVVTTDHNQFYSDTRGGGIPRDWAPGAGPTRGMNGPGEFNTMRRIFGRSAGEEVTIKGGPDPSAFSPPIGRHLLVYDGPHIHGPWHGGGSNTNTIDNVLQTLQTNAQAQNRQPTAYPAHPFLVVPELSSPQWRMPDMERALGMPPFNTRQAFTRDNHPIAKGYQIWNKKDDVRWRGISRDDVERADAWAFFAVANTQTYRWMNQLRHDLRRWSYLIRLGLHYQRRDAVGVRFIRKVYGLGGTDAHGDFNYMTDVSATVLTNSVIHRLFGSDDDMGWTRNAWGRVRTLALTNESGPEKALDAMLHGRSVVTDGPLIAIWIDADSRLWWDPVLKTYNYDHRRTQIPNATPNPFDFDGRMGGDGVMEGARTALMLIPENSSQPRPAPWVRYKVRQPTGLYESGGQIRDVSIWNLPSGRNLWNRSRLCQLEHGAFQGALIYDRPLFPTWEPDGSMNGATFARAATATITQRPPRGANRNWYCWTDNSQTNLPRETSIGVTNPVWWSVGTYRVGVNADCNSGTAVLKDARATITFPNSMQAPTRVFLQALGADGRPAGQAIQAQASNIAISTLDGVQGRKLELRWPQIQLRLTRNRLDLASGGATRSGSILIVIQDPKDHFGNELHPVAMVRHLPSCRGDSHCCELNEERRDRPCFGVSPKGACDACGTVCKHTESCVNDACQDSIGPWNCSGVNCTAPATCCYGRCHTFRNNPMACGGCGQACARDEFCCDTTCTAGGTRAHCSACNDRCLANQDCCGGRCIDVVSNRDNCGACGRECSADEQCCDRRCVRYDDPLNCGACGTRCMQENMRCCGDGSRTGYSCTRIDTDTSCGACNFGCSTPRYKCDNYSCVVRRRTT